MSYSCDPMDCSLPGSSVHGIFQARILKWVAISFSKSGFNSTWTMSFRRTRDRITNIHWIIKKARKFQKNIYFCFIDCAKAFDYVNHNKRWKILKEMGISDHLTSSWEICMQVRKQQLELDIEQQTGSKSGKEYVKAVYCHCDYLTYMQSTSWEMLGWMKHKLESRLSGEISVTSLRNAGDSTLMAPDTSSNSTLWTLHPP